MASTAEFQPFSNPFDPFSQAEKMEFENHFDMKFSTENYVSHQDFELQSWLVTAVGYTLTPWCYKNFLPRPFDSELNCESRMILLNILWKTLKTVF